MTPEAIGQTRNRLRIIIQAYEKGLVSNLSEQAIDALQARSIVMAKNNAKVTADRMADFLDPAKAAARYKDAGSAMSLGISPSVVKSFREEATSKATSAIINPITSGPGPSIVPNPLPQGYNGSSAYTGTVFNKSFLNTYTSPAVSGPNASIGSAAMKILEDCIPCKDRILALKDLRPDKDLLALLEQDLANRLSFLNDLDNLLNTPSMLVDICQLLDFLNFQCIPDLVALLAAMQMLLANLADALLHALPIEVFFNLLANLFGPFLQGLNALLDKYLQMILAPIQCILDALKYQLSKVPNFAAFDKNILDKTLRGKVSPPVTRTDAEPFVGAETFRQQSQSFRQTIINGSRKASGVSDIISGPTQDPFFKVAGQRGSAATDSPPTSTTRVPAGASLIGSPTNNFVANTVQNVAENSDRGMSLATLPVIGIAGTGVLANQAVGAGKSQGIGAAAGIPFDVADATAASSKSLIQGEASLGEAAMGIFKGMQNGLSFLVGYVQLAQDVANGIIKEMRATIADFLGIEGSGLSAQMNVALEMKRVQRVIALIRALIDLSTKGMKCDSPANMNSVDLGRFANKLLSGSTPFQFYPSVNAQGQEVVVVLPPESQPNQATSSSAGTAAKTVQLSDPKIDPAVITKQNSIVIGSCLKQSTAAEMRKVQSWIADLERK